MIQNNLDYAWHNIRMHECDMSNGAVFQNWAQYLLTMQYLSEMTEEQTLTMYSSPDGTFPSFKLKKP
jgi:urocanate hydratase